MALFIAEDTDSTFVVRPGENTLQAAASALTAEGWADAAALSAATAEAASGPTYASTAAGLCHTNQRSRRGAVLGDEEFHAGGRQLQHGGCVQRDLRCRGLPVRPRVRGTI